MNNLQSCIQRVVVVVVTVAVVAAIFAAVVVEGNNVELSMTVR
jgi:hypothetical protein